MGVTFARTQEVQGLGNLKRTLRGKTLFIFGGKAAFFREGDEFNGRFVGGLESLPNIWELSFQAFRADSMGRLLSLGKGREFPVRPAPSTLAMEFIVHKKLRLEGQLYSP